MGSAGAEKYNPMLNVYCLVDGESALAAAGESERRWREGEPRGLRGSFDQGPRGWPTPRGSGAGCRYRGVTVTLRSCRHLMEWTAAIAVSGGQR